MSNFKPRTIGLFAGTFDPVHYGHIGLATLARREGHLDEVWFVLDPKNVSAASERKVTAASYESRMAMLTIALSDEPNLQVYDGALSGKNHTASMFIELLAMYPHDNFVFIFGADTFTRISTWENIESVVRSTTFMVGSRSDLRKDLLEQVRSELGAAGVALRVTWVDFDGFRHVSSTDVREQLRAGESAVEVHPGVLAYIRHHGLYQKTVS